MKTSLGVLFIRFSRIMLKYMHIVAQRRSLYILFLERFRGDRRRNCMKASELQFLGWGSEKNKI